MRQIVSLWLAQSGAALFLIVLLLSDYCNWIVSLKPFRILNDFGVQIRTYSFQEFLMRSISAALSAAVHKSIAQGNNTGNIGRIVITNEAKHALPKAPAKSPAVKN